MRWPTTCVLGVVCLVGSIWAFKAWRTDRSGTRLDALRALVKR